MPGGRTLGDLFFGVHPDTDGFGSDLDRQVSGETRRRGGLIGAGFGRAFAAGGAIVAAAGVGKFLSDSIGEARESQKVGAITNQVIKTTGGVANVTAAAVGRLATRISNKAGIDDEAIQSGENLLLTFKNVRNETGRGNAVFDRATKAAVDLSAAGFGSITSQSKTLGKALNDPIKGLSALSRVGVTFTAGQQKQIKKLTESGHTLQAQKIILGEVESQVGGAAAAAATGGEKFKVAFGNFQEALGTIFLPLLDRTFSVLTPLLVMLTSRLGPAFSKVGTFITNAFSGLQGGSGQLSSTFARVGAALTPLVAVAQRIGASIATNFLPVLRTMATTFTTQILPVLAAVATYVGARLVPIFVQVGTIIATRVVPILASLAQFFYGRVIPAVVAIAIAVGQRLKPVFDAVVSTVQTTVLPAINRLLAKFQQYQPAIQRIVMVVLRVVGVLLVFAAAVLGRVLPPLIRLAGFIIGRLFGALGGIIGIAIRVVGALIRVGAAFINGIKAVVRFDAGVVRAVGSVLRTIGGLPGRIAGALGGLGGLLVNAGRALIDGLARGITARLGGVLDKVRSIAAKIKGFFPGSPVRTGPLRAWNNGGAGTRLVGLLAAGLGRTKPIDEAMARLSGRMNARLAAELAIPARVSSGAPSRPRTVTGYGNGGARRDELVDLVAAFAQALQGLGLELVVGDETFHAFLRAVADGSVRDSRDVDTHLARLGSP